MKIPDYSKKRNEITYLEMQEEIKRLKEEYIILQNASDEVEEEKDKEIERLNKESEQLRTALNSKEGIIKEVREKINKAIINSEIVGNGTLNLSELLEILDKEKE